MATLSDQVKLLMGRPIGLYLYKMGLGFIPCRRIRLVESNLFAMSMSMTMNMSISVLLIFYFSIRG